jgi:hypothetical protein
MTNRDRGAGPVPPGKPRHATPSRHTRGRRPQRKTNPGLRATIPWAAGLCAVVAAVLIVAAESPPPGKHHNTPGQQSAVENPANQPSPSQSSTSPAASPSPSVSKSASTKSATEKTGGDAAVSGSPGWHWHVIADYKGTGAETTGTFRVQPHQKWNLRWSFSCPSGTRGGMFEIQDVAAATTQVNSVIETTAAAAHGTDVVYPDGVRNYLVVTSACPWTAKTIQRS